MYDFKREYLRERETYLSLFDEVCTAAQFAGGAYVRDFEAAFGNYSPLELFRLAVEAVTSFSAAPLAAATLGAILSCVLFLVSLICLIAVSVSQHGFSVSWALMASFWLVALLMFGTLRILGEYLYKVYMETKKRPRFQIETVLGQPPEGSL